MTLRNYTLIPVLVAIILIPQLLFWWLAPMSATARWVIYIGGTILTFGIPVVNFIAYWKSNSRKTICLTIVSCILEIGVIIFSALLLAINATIRSSLFAFAIIGLICLIILIPLISSALKAQRNGIFSLATPDEANNQLFPNIWDQNSNTSDEHLHNCTNVHLPNQRPGNKPLPPRNR